MDYMEEQKSELEAIESIYPTEFVLLTEDPITFKISIHSETYEEGGDDGLKATIKFIFTPTYPEQVPLIEILRDGDEYCNEEEDVLTNLEEEDVKGLKDLLLREANDNIGMAMVFTLCSAANEWLNTRWDEIVKQREQDEERKRIEEDEAEQKRFEGTRVSVQTFITWKTGFDAEREVARKKLQAVAKEKDPDSKKLTGRELFMRDKTLIDDGDLKFDEDEAGPIDESLFEDIEDLDIEGSDED